MTKLNPVKYIAITVMAASLLVACSNPEPPPKDVVQVKRGNVTYTSAGLNELLVKQAIAGSRFEVEQRGDSIVVIMPVKASFNAKRPDVLMPVTLTPLTKIAKLVRQDTSKVMIIVGHTDTSGNVISNNELSLQRAKSVGSVFSVAGLPRTRMFATGVGQNQPRATNNTSQGREQNRRVELIIAPKASGDMETLPNLYAVTNF